MDPSWAIAAPWPSEVSGASAKSSFDSLGPIPRLRPTTTRLLPEKTVGGSVRPGLGYNDRPDVSLFRWEKDERNSGV